MAGGAVVTGKGLGGDAAPKSKAVAVLLTTFAAFGGILFGYDTGTINGIKVMNDWLCTFGTDCQITTAQQSEVVSLLSAGTFFGALAAAPLADWVGRKPGIMFSALVFSIGCAMQTASTHLSLFLPGRVVAGLGVGFISTLCPLYQSECSPKWIRGAVVSCYQWCITLGLLLAAIVDYATQNLNSHASYRIPIGVQLVWGAILGFGMLCLPESPRYLIKKHKDEQAAKVLGRLLACSSEDPLVQAEVADIASNLVAEEQLGGTGWIAMFTPGPSKILYRTMVGIWIQAWQQLTGINFINYYGTTYFSNSGIPNPFLISIATNLMNVGLTIVGGLAVDHVGRRFLLLSGSALMGICEFLVAILGLTLSPRTKQDKKRSSPSSASTSAGSASPGAQAKGVALAAASNWLWNFALGYATPYLVNSGPGNANLGSKVFFIWGACCAAGFAFVFFFVPETRGLSLEQVDILIQESTPLKSEKFRRHLLKDNIHAMDSEGHGISPTPSRAEEKPESSGTESV